MSETERFRKIHYKRGDVITDAEGKRLVEVLDNLTSKETADIVNAMTKKIIGEKTQ